MQCNRYVIRAAGTNCAVRAKKYRPNGRCFFLFTISLNTILKMWRRRFQMLFPASGGVDCVSKTGRVGLFTNYQYYVLSRLRYLTYLVLHLCLIFLEHVCPKISYIHRVLYRIRIYHHVTNHQFQ